MNRPDLTPDSDPGAIAEQLLSDLQRDARAAAPEFVRTMPRAYFDGTTQAMRLAHLKAILAAEASGLSQTLTLREADGSRYTFISNQSYPGQLGELLARLPRELPLISAKVYTANDQSRVLDVFQLGSHVRHDPSDAHQRQKADDVSRQLTTLQDPPPGSVIRRHLMSCDADYLRDTPTAQIVRQFHLVERIRASGNLLVRLEDHHQRGLSLLTLGIPAYDPREVLERVSRHLGARDIDIHRAHLDSFCTAPEGDDICLLGFLVQQDGRPLDATTESWQQLAFELRRLPHLDAAALDLADRLPGCDLAGAELLTALARLAQQRLVKRDPILFTRERIIAALHRYPGLASACVELLERRFAPGATDSAPEAQALLAKIGPNTANPDEQAIFNTLVQAVQATLRSNHRLPERHALALRLDPGFLDDPGREERPFGVFYLHGAGFDGFHVRFRDISRGGVRIVRPRGWEQYALESERHYDEVYALAFAQQHKNKDIPEGGSKGVILAAPDADLESVARAYADALLDLIIPDPLLKGLHADHYPRDELLYLGPDENISERLITWIVERARLRSHPMPAAFMSSKPGAGINHKVYGVTSEGVTVFLDAALRTVGIDPSREAFTVKITGGPDGDVAGNEILILARDYRDRARILGIADASGCAEDPAGLDIDELVRLVRAGLPITAFSAERLSPRGRVVGIDEPDGMQLRNSMHNRIASDAFIPAGGRPGTIDGDSWEAFLTADGQPSSRVIVEGANLFIAPDARERLAERGVVIIKDSSANKAGVICSSYEIIASMLLDEATFLQIKERFVDEVLQRLRMFAGLEAETLFREHRHKPKVHLPELSLRLSRVINRATDALTDRIDAFAGKHPDLIEELVLQHLPPVLSEVCENRIIETIPPAYLHRVIGSALASRIVYREGLDWLESMPDASIVGLAERYLIEEARIRDLVEQVRGSNLEQRERIAILLERGGVGAALRSSP